MLKKKMTGILLAAVMAVTTVAPAALPQTANAAEGAAKQKIEAESYLKTGTKAVVKWNKVKGADKYIVSRKKGSGEWKKLKTVSAKTTKISQKSLSRKTTYRYKVEAVDKVEGENVTTAKDTTSVYVPKKLTKKTKTYSKTNQAKVIRLARSKLGKRYVWGAEGPDSFDCSGYVYWVMKHSGVAGVKVKRYTAQGIYNAYKRYSIGRSVSKAQPGDIILFGRNKSRHSIYHAAIYYGNGKVIHASTGWGGGRKVKITNIDRRNVAAIIRLKGLR